MDKVVFSKDWEQFFTRHGLKSFDDFYNCTGGDVVGKNTKRNVQKLTFGQGAERKTFFMKRFHKPHLKDTAAALWNFGRPTSLAGLEWKNAQTLLENGIDTYKPVCLGERTVAGFERMSFLVTEQLESVSMLDFVLRKWNTLGRSAQEKIVTAMANLVRQVHELEISLPDLYIWHVFIREDCIDNEIKLAVIDLHRMVCGVESLGKRAKELGKLYWSLSSEYFDDELKDLLLSTYIGEAPEGTRERLVRKALRFVKVVDKRRNLTHHYEMAMAELT